jgi:hypothetical protein
MLESRRVTLVLKECYLSSYKNRSQYLLKLYAPMRRRSDVDNILYKFIKIVSNIQ